ncbi:MAG: hypothetical protein KAG18_04410 [Sinobacterium sp.]|nr:hypothetical protein [Sinobacterium sp.]
MLNNPFKSRTRTEESKKPDADTRSDRLYQEEGRWFFKTREGMDIGPFQNKNDAQYALLYFAERAEWPTDDQLNDFIEGCQLFDEAE